ncbi:chemotaxis protein CheW [Aquabacterium humicola]|uniref:chemotaxis protein CheW n=1 Tax=Aquabacterium humicola TaxID=3237377 RepID=UPI002543529C|nr:chemotaxis protein CheW [Rubrivivax pictus]
MTAPVHAAAPAAQDPAQYLSFVLRGEVYAIGILAIKEIIEYGGLTAVPMMPPAIRGVINLRGAVVPVLDLALRFGKPAAEPTKRTCIVIVELALGGVHSVVGLVVDAVNAVQEIAPADIEPPPAFGTAIATPFIAGMGKVDGRFVILLDIDQVLAIEGLGIAAGVEDEAALPA